MSSKSAQSGDTELFAIVQHTASCAHFGCEVYNVTEIKHFLGPREAKGKPRRKCPYTPVNSQNFDPVSLYELKTRRDSRTNKLHTYRVYILMLSDSQLYLESILKSPELRDKHLKTEGLDLNVSEEETESETDTDDCSLRSLKHTMDMAKELKTARISQHASTLEKLNSSGQLDVSAHLNPGVDSASAWRLVKQLREELQKQKEEAANLIEEAKRKEEETKRKEEEAKRKEEELRKKEAAILSVGNIDLKTFLQSVQTLNGFQDNSSRLEKLEADITFIKDRLSKYNDKKNNYIWEWLQDVQAAPCK